MLYRRHVNFLESSVSFLHFPCCRNSNSLLLQEHVVENDKFFDGYNNKETTITFYQTTAFLNLTSSRTILMEGYVWCWKSRRIEKILHPTHKWAVGAISSEPPFLDWACPTYSIFQTLKWTRMTDFVIVEHFIFAYLLSKSRRKLNFTFKISKISFFQMFGIVQ